MRGRSKLLIVCISASRLFAGVHRIELKRHRSASFLTRASVESHRCRASPPGPRGSPRPRRRSIDARTRPSPLAQVRSGGARSGARACRRATRSPRWQVDPHDDAQRALAAGAGVDPEALREIWTSFIQKVWEVNTRNSKLLMNSTHHANFFFLSYE